MKTDIIKRALQEIGTKEIPGPNDNPEVMKYFLEIGHSWVKDDETAWCAAFANWVLMKERFEHTGMLNARSFLKLGNPVHGSPEIGDVVVLWRIRPDSAYGHVGFFIRKHAGNIYILGGNQGNQVSISPYPENRLISYREPQRMTTINYTLK